MEPAVVPEMPPYDRRAFAFQGQPDSNVGFVVKIGHDDFTPIAQRLANRNTDQPQKGGSIHAKRDLIGMPGIDQQSDTAAGLGDGLVHFLRVPVSPAPLHIAMEKMVSNRA